MVALFHGVPFWAGTSDLPLQATSVRARHAVPLHLLSSLPDRHYEADWVEAKPSHGWVVQRVGRFLCLYAPRNDVVGQLVLQMNCRWFWPLT